MAISVSTALAKLRLTLKTGFLRDQTPTPGDSTYLDRLYSLQITS